MGPVPLEWLSRTVTWSPRMHQLDVICDLGISFNVDNSWMSWTLDMEIVLSCQVHPDFSCT
jgi:hypothetical protein